jgi:predicted amidohydrolase YtcJ
MRTCVDLASVEDKAVALDLIAARNAELVFVLGWNDSLFDFDTDDLEALPPVFIVNTSLHGFRVNEGGRERLRQTHAEVVERLDDQAWIERKLHRLLKLIVDVQGCDARCLTAFYDSLLERGVWYAQDMLLPGLASIEAIERAGLFERTLLWADPGTYRALDPNARTRVHGIKLFMDGALGAYTAAMNEPLLTGQRGILLRTDNELRDTLGGASDYDRPLAIHVLGDRAMDQILAMLERLEGDGVSFPGVRLEHCQFITSEHARRVKALGATLSMQPNFSIETLVYADRLTPEQCARNNPFRRLIDEDGFVPGEDLVLGSDGMPHGAEFALRMSLFPPLPSQAMTLEEFVAGYCMPDDTNGSIALEIDDDARTVSVGVDAGRRAGR